VAGVLGALARCFAEGHWRWSARFPEQAASPDDREKCALAMADRRRGRTYRIRVVVFEWDNRS